MKKERKVSPTELPLAFEIDHEPATATWTARGGIPLVVHAMRSLGLSGEAFVGADIGGFIGRANGELLTRWYHVGFLTTLAAS